ncbi:hypothetical protein, partial [Bradyrhizobium sp. P5_C11_2]
MSDLWIPPYHRDQMPEGTDNSEFGEVLSLASPLESNRELSILDTAYEVTRHFHASGIFPKNANSGRNVYSACDATIERVICRPLPTTLFFPDNAAIVATDDGQRLITESLWHSE